MSTIGDLQNIRAKVTATEGKYAVIEQENPQSDQGDHAIGGVTKSENRVLRMSSKDAADLR